jgi:hypothetical protein
MDNIYQVALEGGIVQNLRREELLEVRQAEAIERQAHRDTLSNEQQIAALDNRLGAGVGATKERARLAA